MDNLRVDLADTLRKHYFWWPNHASIGSQAHCQCGERPRDWSYWAGHAAAVLSPLLSPSVEVQRLHELVRRGLAYGDQFRTPYAAAARAELRRAAGMTPPSPGGGE